jgi:hypothetical protein
MSHLYSCRHAGDEYRITKFDAQLNVESSYLCTLIECECPAGERATCRHRQMLPKFLQRGAVDSEWFLDFDRGGWVQMEIEMPADAGRLRPPGEQAREVPGSVSEPAHRVGYELQGTAYDPYAVGHELQGRDPAPTNAWRRGL